MELQIEQERAYLEWERWSLLNRLLSRLTENEDGCWVYGGAVTPHGYGTISTGGRDKVRQIAAHRVAWSLLVGPIPDQMVLDHLCRRRACCRPSHLEMVTSAENTRRKGTAKLTWESVREMRAQALGGTEPAVLAEQFGISRTHVQNVLTGRSWADRHDA